MKKSRAILALVLLVLVVAGIVAAWMAPRLDRYQVDGEIVVDGLGAPVEVVRDEKGMAYVYAEDLDDLVWAQGFVTAQDRLFPMHLARLASQGRLVELAGEVALPIDTYRRTLGFHRLAKAHAAILDEETRRFFECYAAGVNAYLEGRREEWPLAFRLAGVEPEPWTVEDSLSILYYMAWGSSANLRHEIVTQLLVEAVGEERARSLAPLNVNPDDPEPVEATPVDESMPAEAIRAEPLGGIALLDSPLLRDDAPRLGSNNWAVAPERSPSGAPIVAGDPHLDPRMIPGIWYPVGLVRGDRRAVGASVPGIPGIVIGRTDHLAFSVTNAYGDAQDLFVETVDPEDPSRYFEGGRSVAFGTIRETLRVRGAGAPGGFHEETITIRTTPRGPVITDSLPDARPEAVLTLRWAAAEAIVPEMGARLGFVDLFDARDVAEMDAALRHLPMTGLHWVFADEEGGIAWRVSGRLPQRVDGAGRAPWPVDPVEPFEDPWIGWIPFEDMPHARGSERGWLGTANHFVARGDDPFYLTDFASPSYRYRRMIELFKATPVPSVEEHWAWQLDVENLLARRIAPIFADALLAHDATRDLGEVLESWDHRDEVDAAGPVVFQEVMRQLALAVFRDELGEEVAEAMLGDWYFWQERFERMVVDAGAGDESPWFDDVSTPEVETLPELVRRAGEAARARLAPEIGPDPRAWRWGDLHTLTFSEPIRREGAGARWLGSGPHAAPGSGETLHRGWYEFAEPYAVTHTASLRMVADLGDPDQIRAVLPGGIAARLFHPHRDDQVDDFVTGTPRPWWFSDAAIDEHAAHRLRLVGR